MILILIVRIVTFVILFWDEEKRIQVVNSFSETLYLGVTEVIPCLVISFSFVAKTVRGESSLGSLDGGPGPSIQSSERSLSQSLLLGRVDPELLEADNRWADEHAQQQ